MEVQRRKGSNAFPTAREPYWQWGNDIIASHWCALLWKMPAGEADGALTAEVWLLHAHTMWFIHEMDSAWACSGMLVHLPGRGRRKQACVLFKYAFIPFPLRVQSHKLSCPFQVPLRRCVRPCSCLRRPAPTLSLLCHCIHFHPTDNARSPGVTVVPEFLYSPGCTDQTQKLEPSPTPAASQHPTRTLCNQATLLPGRSVQDLTVIAHYCNYG